MSDSEIAGNFGQVFVWEGCDPVAFSRVLGALNDRGIECVSLDQHRMSLFSNARTKGFAIVVDRLDHSRASKIVSDLLSEQRSD